MTDHKTPRRQSLGPALVALGAALWATDAVFRAQLIGTYSPVSIVWTSHLICLVVTLPLVAMRFRQIKNLSIREWLLIIYIACAGGALAMVLFTEAFARTSNYTIPILIQKLQPMIALLLAWITLGERLSRHFFTYAAGAVVGAYLVSFGWHWVLADIRTEDQTAIWYALGAAAIWGSTTVAGRRLSCVLSSYALTALRYVIATGFLTIWCLVAADANHLGSESFHSDLVVFIPMALGPGLIALFIYYFGLGRTPAATATFCELTFPVGAIFVNWVFLDTPLSLAQIVGATLLLWCVMQLSYPKTRSRRQAALPATHLT